MAVMMETGIPEMYLQMEKEEWFRRIRLAKEALGEQLLILGHHYQRDDVIQFADLTGDSFKLARLASENRTAKYVVFCGVHFMAETADMLTSNEQSVILPDLAAGCSMADMANDQQVERAWKSIGETFEGVTIPITYVNSTASLKAFCGKYDGAVCTSSNAKQILTHAFAQGDRVLFFPDEHLGRNTSMELGILPENMVVYDQRRDVFEWLPGQTPDMVKVVLWKGFCSVHQRFHVKHIEHLRREHPGIRILVHPECNHDVVSHADLSGSTEFIIKQVREAAPGTKWAIGTEVNLVNRLVAEHPEQEIYCVNPIVCPCTTMSRITPEHLAYVLDELTMGRVIHQITVPEDVSKYAVLALDRMLTIA